MSKLQRFIEANPNDPRVVRLVKLMDKPLRRHSARCGRLVGELLLEVNGHE